MFRDEVTGNFIAEVVVTCQLNKTWSHSTIDLPCACKFRSGYPLTSLQTPPACRPRTPRPSRHT